MTCRPLALPWICGQSGGSAAAAGQRADVAARVGAGTCHAGFVVLLFAAYELVGTNLSEEHSQAHARPGVQRCRCSGSAGHRASQQITGAAATGTKGAPGATAVGATSTDVDTPGAKTTGRSDRQTASRASRARRAGKSERRPSGPGRQQPHPPPGGALDHLVIPAIGLSRYVVQGVTETDLQMGPGHYPGTPLPGQAGNVGIAGHRTTFGAPFFRLNEVSRGDRILLTDTSGTTWVYSVVKQWVVPPADTGVLDPNARRHAHAYDVQPSLRSHFSPGREGGFARTDPPGFESRQPVGHSRERPVAGQRRQHRSGGQGHAAADHRDGPPGPRISTNPLRASANGGQSGEGSPTVGSASSPVAESQSQSQSQQREWMGVAGHNRFRVAGVVRVGRDPRFCRPYAVMRRSS